VRGIVPVAFFMGVQAYQQKLGKDLRKVDHMSMARDIIAKFRKERER
jgi:hypothetical protein